MNKFKVGDRVVWTKCHVLPSKGTKGVKGIIIESWPYNRYVFQPDVWEVPYEVGYRADKSFIVLENFLIPDLESSGIDVVYSLQQTINHPELIIQPHDCALNIRTYDSGWSKYDYCNICDKKFE